MCNDVLFPSTCSAACQSQPSIDSTFCLFLLHVFLPLNFLPKVSFAFAFCAVLFTTGHLYDGFHRIGQIHV